MKISNQTLWAKRKIGSLKNFRFPHLKYQFPKAGEQNHPSVKLCSMAQVFLSKIISTRRTITIRFHTHSLEPGQCFQKLQSGHR